MPAILVVDDEQPNRELLRLLLEHDGHVVILAASGEQALTLLEERRPDLIIVDLHMPRMSGTDFIKAVRSHGEAYNTRIALYTGTETGAAMRDFMLLMRIGGVIPKPAEPEEIIDAVRAALR